MVLENKDKLLRSIFKFSKDSIYELIAIPKLDEHYAQIYDSYDLKIKHPFKSKEEFEKAISHIKRDINPQINYNLYCTINPAKYSRIVKNSKLLARKLNTRLINPVLDMITHKSCVHQIYSIIEIENVNLTESIISQYMSEIELIYECTIVDSFITDNILSIVVPNQNLKSIFNMKLHNESTKNMMVNTNVYSKIITNNLKFKQYGLLYIKSINC